MYPYLRLLKTLWQSSRRPPIDPITEGSSIAMRVWPQDADEFGELNNGRFLTLMDLGRYDFGGRCSLPAILRRNRWGLMVGAVYIRYRRRLPLFSTFELHTEMVGRDERWFYFHQFTRTPKHKFHSSAIVRATITSKNGLVPTTALMRELGLENAQFDTPDWVRKWQEIDIQMPKL